MDKNQIQIELKHPDLDEVISKPTSRFVRFTIFFLIFCLILLLFGSYYIKLPQVINAPITLSTENPPVYMYSHNSGKLEKLFVLNNSIIDTNTIVAVIENPANLNDALYLENFINTIQPEQQKNDTLFAKLLGSNLILGELQVSFSDFSAKFTELQNFHNNQLYNKQIEELSLKLKEYDKLKKSLKAKLKISLEEKQLLEKQFKRDTALLKSGYLSQSEFEKAKSNFNKGVYNFEETNSQLLTININYQEVEQVITDKQLQLIERTEKLNSALKEAFKIVVSSVSEWERKYILRSPIKGKVVYGKFWSPNQFIAAEELFCSVVPEDSVKIICRGFITTYNAGKVKAGQKAQIQFDNYPYSEFGYVSARLVNISSVPFSNNYYVEFSLPNELTTNYNLKLPLNQNMKGNASIIVSNISLLQRVIYPIKYFLKKQN